MAPKDNSPAESCPVDHSAREAWLKQVWSGDAQERAQAQNQLSSAASRLPADHPPVPGMGIPIPAAAREKASATLKTRPLAEDREVSTIPRTKMSPAAGASAPTIASVAATAASSSTTTSPTASHAANSETETGADAATGNWIYPSEKQFFDAMRRKHPHTLSAQTATDVAAIVPIHNAVNERAWKMIREWEAGFGWARAANARCGGPRLHSFAGDSQRLTPRARWKVFWGYQRPFDRHDWVVERCPGAERVEYVIDFYAGRDEGKKGKSLNFYLDVRPKLNSWEGWKMRFCKFWGVG